MADTSFEPFTRSLRLLATALGALVLAALSGCVLLESGTATNPPEPPPLPVNEVMTFWDPSLRFAQDPLHNGTPLPGLAGRVYLENVDLKRMVDAGGSIHVAVRNTTPGAPANQPHYAVTCEFKELDLKRLKKVDIVGAGYTLFVPWETYRPDIKQIEVQVCYAPRGGSHHYSTPTVIGLKAENSFPIERRQQVFGPGQAPQPQVFGPAPASQPQAFVPASPPQVFVPGQAPR